MHLAFITNLPLDRKQHPASIPLPFQGISLRLLLFFFPSWRRGAVLVKQMIIYANVSSRSSVKKGTLKKKKKIETKKTAEGCTEGRG